MLVNEGTVLENRIFERGVKSKNLQNSVNRFLSKSFHILSYQLLQGNSTLHYVSGQRLIISLIIQE